MRALRTGIVSLALAAVVGAAALVPARAAFADDTAGHHHHHGHRQGLLGAAGKLDSLTADQRSSIEQLIAQSRDARTPVRQADAQVLEVLAHQVEQASIDPQGLAPTLSLEQTAATNESAVERDALNRLHAILTPAQRGQLVDGIEAHFHAGRGHADGGASGEGSPGAGRGEHGLGLTPAQKAQIAANLRAEGGANPGAPMRGMLEAFRGDAFDAGTFLSVVAPGERAEHLAEAMVPVLSPAQRATLANHLRTRAAHESHS
jgi:Spy/CpxP family protein refolding chaperone